MEEESLLEMITLREAMAFCHRTEPAQSTLAGRKRGEQIHDTRGEVWLIAILNPQHKMY